MCAEKLRVAELAKVVALEWASPESRTQAIVEDPSLLHDLIQLAKESLVIDISECVHCGCFTFNARSETCSCGQELYPVSKRVEAGEAFDLRRWLSG